MMVMMMMIVNEGVDTGARLVAQVYLVETDSSMDLPTKIWSHRRDEMVITGDRRKWRNQSLGSFFFPAFLLPPPHNDWISKIHKLGRLPVSKKGRAEKESESVQTVTIYQAHTTSPLGITAAAMNMMENQLRLSQKVG